MRGGAKPKITWDFGYWGADLRRIASSVSYRVWAALLTTLGAALCFAPLFNALGYEFSVAIGGFAGLASGYLGVAAANAARTLRRTRPVGHTFGAAWIVSALLTAPPLILIVLNGFRVDNCQPAAGFLYYAAIPQVSVVYGAAAGTFFGLWTQTRRAGALLWTLWAAATIAAGALHALMEPPIFAYHSLLGLVQGSIYDDEMFLTPTLIAARLLTLLTAAAFLAAAWAFHSPTRQRLTLRALFYGRPNRTLPAALLTICAAALCFGWVFRGEIGWRPSRADLHAALSGRIETERFVIRFEETPSIREEIEQTALDHEYRYDQLRRFFGIDPASKQKIRSYIYADRDLKRRLQGAKNAHMADPFNLEIHLIEEPFPHRSLKHELAHLFAGELQPAFKLSPALGLIEGAAVAAAWEVESLTPHQKAKSMLIEDRLPALKTLMSPIGFWTTPPSRSYPAVGSFSRWLIERSGLERFQTAYSSGNFQRAYGEPLSSLELEWKEFLQTASLPEERAAEARAAADRIGVFERACPHETANLRAEARNEFAAGNYASAERIFLRLSEMEPGNVEPLRLVMQTRRAAGDWEGARRAANRILALETDGGLRAAEALSALGDAHWQLGKTDIAGAAYETVRERRTSPALYRAADIKQSALELPADSREWARRYLLESGPARFHSLMKLLESAPEWRYGAYLLGRALFNAREWADALNALTEAGPMIERDAEYRYETNRLRALCLYRLNRLLEAERAFDKASESAARAAERRAMLDWRERVQWERARASRVLSSSGGFTLRVK